MAPASQPERAVAAPKSNTDVVLLDLVEFVAEQDKPSARDGPVEIVRQVRESGTDVFALVDSELLYADLHACICPELTGVVVSHLESVAQVEEADSLISKLEDERGIPPGTLEMVFSLDMAQATEDAFEIASASRRITGLTLGRAELVMDLRPEPSGEIHLMQYLMQKIITVAGAWRHGADAITLDLEDGVVPALKAGARELVRDAVAVARKGSAEVFVRVKKEFLVADVEASTWPGLAGIMLPKVESAEDVVEASDALTSAERRRGIEPGMLRLILLLESANAVFRVREIIAASERVSQVGLDESDLSASLGISPVAEYDPFVYARGRMAIEATAAGVEPIGIAHPLGTLPRLLSGDDMLKAATDSKNLGFKGIICPHTSWVSSVNTAFTPTESQVDFYTQVRDVFAQAIAAGTAAVPFAGRMIDVPVDEWAKVVIATSTACNLRDAEKQTAMEAASV